MLEKLLWPKEMQLIMRQYRAEGCLNEKAFQHNRRIALILAILYGLLVIGFAVKSIPISYYFVALGLALAAYAYDAYTHLNRVLIPYTMGNRCQARVLSLKYFRKTDASPFGYYLSYEFGGQTKDVQGLTEEESEYLKQQGDYITVLVHPMKLHHNIPFLPSWNEKFNLKTKQG